MPPVASSTAKPWSPVNEAKRPGGTVTKPSTVTVAPGAERRAVSIGTGAC